MSIAICSSFLLECLTGVHDLSTDVIKCALFDGSADFDIDTTAYSTTNEAVAGDGYTAGGVTLALSSGYPQIENDRAGVRFDDASWTLTANKTVRWALIYNSSKSNKAILSIDLFGQARTVTGSFSLGFPLALAPIINLSCPVVR
jgi:hypothetical protein